MTRQSQCLDLHSVHHPVSVRALIRDALRGAWSTFKTWSARYRQRRELLTLSDRMLKDIGISRAQAEDEGNKPFWE